MNDISNLNVKYEAGSEISLADIVEFIQESWKQLILAGVVGAMLGFWGWWFFLGSYKEELVLLNNTNTFGLDLLSWRILQINLPNLADQLVKNDKLAQEFQLSLDW